MANESISLLTEGKIKYVNDKGDKVPKECPKCGSKVGIYLRGEPVFLCSNKKCEKYFGTVPFSESAFMDTSVLESRKQSVESLLETDMQDRNYLTALQEDFSFVDNFLTKSQREDY